MMTSAARDALALVWMSVGMPRPSSITVHEPSALRIDLHVAGVTGQRLVDGVVHYLVDHVVQAGAVVGVADVHAGALAHCVQSLQHPDGFAHRSRRRTGSPATGVSTGFGNRSSLISVLQSCSRAEASGVHRHLLRPSGPVLGKAPARSP